MKFLLKYNYNLEEPTVYRKQNEIYIKDKNNKYIFCEIVNKEEFDEINYFCQHQNLHKYFYEIIKTINNSNFVIYKNKQYALLKIPDESERNISDYLHKNFPISLNQTYKIDRSNWYFLWSRKNDYIEYQYKYIKGKNVIIDESIDYYIGLAENAILYLHNTVNVSNDSLYVSHRRIDQHSFFNPTNIVLDRRERDVSEYIKYLFFNSQNIDSQLQNIIDVINKEQLSLEIIYARLLYPTYYFDIYEQYEMGIIIENKLKNIITQVEKYEKFLKNIFVIFSTKKKIKKIDWLK